LAINCNENTEYNNNNNALFATSATLLMAQSIFSQLIKFVAKTCTSVIFAIENNRLMTKMLQQTLKFSYYT